MKRIRKYFLVIAVFMIIMGLVLLFFLNRFNNIEVTNKAKLLLKDLYELKEGKYKFKNGIIYTENNSVVSNKYYLDGNGNIEIDKYGNIRFSISNGDKCINKTYIGNISVDKECISFNNIKVSMSRNNSTISFKSKVKNLEYKISKKDNFKGKWIKEDYSDNIVLKYYSEGVNYIWFKDEKGNISNPIEFNIDCLNTNDANYDSTVFYCSGSVVSIDNIDYVVLEDNSNNIKLMKKEPLKDKLSLCIKDNKNYCYVDSDDRILYRWSTSYINDYLNSMYINTLSDSVKSKLVEMEICADYDNFCGDEYCGGFTREEIESNEFKCNKYTKSKVKLISYYEFNYAYANSKNKSNLKGNYFAINSYINNFASSVQNNYEFYVLESVYNKLDIKPVIVLNK